ncbi:MAG: phosphodiester glycosidase family protein [Acidobacteria bacterium]|nr:MAG: phosphodiester glycosidase family protein [Acidobacteriota bacterium]
MKSKNVFIHRLNSLLKAFTLLWLWLLLSGSNSNAQNFLPICEGIEHAEVIRKINGVDVRLNLLRLDPQKIRLDVIHAMDTVNGTEALSSIAKRHGAIAAINAGFFRFDRSIFAGTPSGILMIDGKLFSMSHSGRSAVAIINDSRKTDIAFAHVDTEVSLKISNKKIPISGMNRERKIDDIVLFTPEFGRSTLTDPNGWEFIFQSNDKKPSSGRLVEIRKNKGSSIIPQYGFVLSVSDSKLKILPHILKKLGVIASWQFTIKTIESSESKFFQMAEDITNGVPQLIRNGEIQITWEQEKTNQTFVETRHPRTAIARLKDGQILLITADGRSEDSGGIALKDLAELLLQLGAFEAINLDGGGSTTMFLNGKIVNKPSDKEGERRISDAILVFPRANCKR